MKSIRQIAASLEATSTAAAKRALKDAGMKQTLAPDLLEAKAEIDSARNAKRCARAAIHRRPTGRKPVTLPVGMLAQRLETLRKTAVRCAFVRAFRQPAHGDLSIMLTDDPAKVGVVQRDYDDWNIYAKSYKKGPAKCLDNTITAPAMWRARVDKRGLAVVDGMMTLDAAVIEGAPEESRFTPPAGSPKAAGTASASATATSPSATDSATTPTAQSARWLDSRGRSRRLHGTQKCVQQTFRKSLPGFRASLFDCRTREQSALASTESKAGARELESATRPARRRLPRYMPDISPAPHRRPAAPSCTPPVALASI